MRKVTEDKSVPEDPASEGVVDSRTQVKKQRSSSRNPEAKPAAGFPIVGIGASAGGLSAVEAFFSEMPTEVELKMAFIMVQHLAPDHKSLLGDIIKRYTRMQVVEVKDRMKVEPNCVYVIPPNRDMALQDGALHLFEPDPTRHSIDFFFRSLAQDRRERAIGIVLSGTGSDGTLGLRAVKGEGGVAIVQDPDTTEYDSMPRSAIATGLVDYVLPPEKMPARLMAYVSHAFGSKRRIDSARPAFRTEDGLKKICIVLRDKSGHDFSQYKLNTLVRRIERRMAILQIDNIDDYQRYLQQTSREIELLYRDLLIGVTSFFRDAEAFAVLEKKVVPKLFEGKRPGDVLRVWVCGCSTGEEAYSIAMLLQEQADILKRDIKLQIFATDLDKHAIEQARGGLYPASIADDVSAERLTRFFIHAPGGDAYQIKRSIRDFLVFSEQDVIRDPPFSKLDLISCRNLLIYLSSEPQKKIISMFHYALNQNGALFLGTSESIGEFTNLFSVVDRKAKVYQRLAGVSEAAYSTFGLFPPTKDHAEGPAGGIRKQAGGIASDFRNLMECALLDHYVQAALLTTDRGDILHIYGRTGKYLEPAPGDAEMNVIAMAREGLMQDLSTALHSAVVKKEPIRRRGLHVQNGDSFLIADVIVRPVAAMSENPARDLYLVLFEEREDREEETDEASPSEGESTVRSDERIAALEDALRSKEEYLQTSIEEMQTSTEELRASNEELQSVNEELQSTNEELETSKEELQSINEEHATANAELQNKVADLSRANSDMENLLASTGVATLFVNQQLKISRFTPSATQIINLIESDVGRPIGHIVSNLANYDRLVEDLKEVLDSLVPRDVEVRSKGGVWYLMRIRPYRTQEHIIEGVVITFVDITARKEMESSLRDKDRFLECLSETIREPFLVLNRQLVIVTANLAFYRKFGEIPDTAKSRSLFELSEGGWDRPELRKTLEDCFVGGEDIEGFKMPFHSEKQGPRTLSLNIRQIASDSGYEARLLVAIADSDRKELISK